MTDSRGNVIELHDVTKVYRMGDIEVNALAGVSLTIRRGEMTAIMGPSGSGQVDHHEHNRLPRRADGGQVPPRR